MVWWSNGRPVLSSHLKILIIPRHLWETYSIDVFIGRIKERSCIEWRFTLVCSVKPTVFPMSFHNHECHPFLSQKCPSLDTLLFSQVQPHHFSHHFSLTHPFLWKPIHLPSSFLTFFHTTFSSHFCRCSIMQSPLTLWNPGPALSTRVSLSKILDVETVFYLPKVFHVCC